MIKRLRILPLVVVFLIFGCKSRQSTIPSKEETPEVAGKKKKETPKDISEEIPKEIPGEEIIISKKEKRQPPLNIEEFRGAWVATVANINWPSKGGLPTLSNNRKH